MSKLAKEFRDFLGQTNVLALAIAVVLGAAFGAVVTSFVNDILMQLIAALGIAPNFGELAVTINGSPIRYGRFINALLSFLIVGFALFLVMKAAMKLQRPKPEAKAPETEVDVLRDIRETLRAQSPLSH